MANANNDDLVEFRPKLDETVSSQTSSVDAGEPSVNAAGRLIAVLESALSAPDQRNAKALVSYFVERTIFSQETATSVAIQVMIRLVALIKSNLEAKGVDVPDWNLDLCHYILDPPPRSNVSALRMQHLREHVVAIRDLLADIYETRREYRAAASVLLSGTDRTQNGTGPSAASSGQPPNDVSGHPVDLGHPTKVDLYVRAARLLLDSYASHFIPGSSIESKQEADDSLTDAENLVNRAAVASATSTQIASSTIADGEDSTSIATPSVACNLMLKLCQARILDYKTKFVESAMRYFELMNMSKELRTETDVFQFNDNEVQAIAKCAFVCTLLAPVSSNKTRLVDLLHTEAVHWDAKLPDLCTLVKWIHLNALVNETDFSRRIKPYIAGHHLHIADSLVREAVAQHNTVLISSMYSTIRLTNLAKLLNVNDADAESVVARLLTERHVVGEIDQVDGLVRFGSISDAKRQSDHAMVVCTKLNAIVDAIQRAEPEWYASHLAKVADGNAMVVD